MGDAIVPVLAGGELATASEHDPGGGAATPPPC
jgi:hypothetical protein